MVIVVQPPMPLEMIKSFHERSKREITNGLQIPEVSLDNNGDIDLTCSEDEYVPTRKCSKCGSRAHLDGTKDCPVSAPTFSPPQRPNRWWGHDESPRDVMSLQLPPAARESVAEDSAKRQHKRRLQWTQVNAKKPKTTQTTCQLAIMGGSLSRTKGHRRTTTASLSWSLARGISTPITHMVLDSQQLIMQSWKGSQCFLLRVERRVLDHFLSFLDLREITLLEEGCGRSMAKGGSQLSDALEAAWEVLAAHYFVFR